MVLEEAIHCRMAADHPLGTESSGGLDSATITAYLAHFLGDPGDNLHGFGFALHEQEPGLILATSQARHITHNHIFTVQRDLAVDDATVDRALRVMGYPEGQGNATGHVPFYAECELRGIRTLFSGHGGDQVATNPGSHLRWELLDAHRYGALWGVLPGTAVRRALRVGKAATVGRKKPAYNPQLLAAFCLLYTSPSPRD